jgi:hypothetical protein
VAVDTPTYFAQVIQDHLELKRRNAELEERMPIDRYKTDDPFGNHPLFKTEEQARIEDTLEGDGEVVGAWTGDETVEHVFIGADEDEPVERLWGRSREFDWGD